MFAIKWSKRVKNTCFFADFFLAELGYIPPPLLTKKKSAEYYLTASLSKSSEWRKANQLNPISWIPYKLWKPTATTGELFPLHLIKPFLPFFLIHPAWYFPRQSFCEIVCFEWAGETFVYVTLWHCDMCRIVGGQSWDLGIGISSQVCWAVGMKRNMQILASRLVGPVLAESMYM